MKSINEKRLQLEDAIKYASETEYNDGVLFSGDTYKTYNVFVPFKKLSEQKYQRAPFAILVDQNYVRSSNPKESEEIFANADLNASVFFK